MSTLSDQIAASIKAEKEKAAKKKPPKTKKETK